MGRRSLVEAIAFLAWVAMIVGFVINWSITTKTGTDLGGEDFSSLDQLSTFWWLAFGLGILTTFVGWAIWVKDTRPMIRVIAPILGAVPAILGVVAFVASNPSTSSAGSCANGLPPHCAQGVFTGTTTHAWSAGFWVSVLGLSVAVLVMFGAAFVGQVRSPAADARPDF
jgi:hypothetical protein